MRMLEQYTAQIVKPDWLHKVVPVNITPAARWLYETNNQEHFDWSEDFPCVAGPWPLAWLEWEPPRFFNSEGRIVQTDYAQAGVTGMGCMVETFHLDGEDFAAIVADDGVFRTTAVEIIAERARVGLDTAPTQAIMAMRRQVLNDWLIQVGPGPGFVLRCHFYLGRDRRSDVTSIGLAEMYLDRDGRIVPESPFYTPAARAAQTEEQANDVGGLMRSLMHAVLFALSLMHCKNVELAEDAAVPRKVAKKRAAKGRGSIHFKTLVVDPLRRAASRSADGRAGREAIRHAMHIVRGHFATYTDEAPLFGRVTGTFWRPMHVRGTPDVGRVVKDYRVKR